MALALEAKAKADDIMVGDTPKAKKRRRKLEGVETQGRLWKHSTLRDVEGLISRDEMKTMFVFTMVRNPWDRVASYYFWLQHQNFDHMAVHKAKALGFSEFLRDRLISKSLRAAPYPSYVSDPMGTECCDLFLRLEHLDEDMPKLEKALGVKLGVLAQENKSVRVATTELYSQEDRDYVASLCASDINRFGYRFPS